MCVKCDEKDAYIKELEQALEGAVWPQDDHMARISRAFGLSPQRAALVDLLYQGGERYTNVIDLEAGIPLMKLPNRQPKMISVIVYYIRRKCGPAFIENHVNGGRDSQGYRLGKEARAQVKALLA